MATVSDPLAMLRVAMDNVPLTAEQRRKIVEEFSLLLGLKLNYFQNEEVAKKSLPPSYAEIMAAEKELISSSKSVAVLPQSEIQSIVQKAIQTQKISHNTTLLAGITKAGITGFILGLLFVIPIALYLQRWDAFKWLYISSIFDGVAVFILLYLLGSAHQYLWKMPRNKVLVTIFYGVIAPISTTLNIFARLHEILWETPQPVSRLRRVGEGLLAIMSIPVGVFWMISGYMLRGYISHKNSKVALK